MTFDQALDAILLVEQARYLSDLGIGPSDLLPPAAREPGIPEPWRRWARLHGWIGHV